MKFISTLILIGIGSGMAGSLMETVFHVTSYQAYFWLGYVTASLNALVIAIEVEGDKE